MDAFKKPASGGLELLHFYSENDFSLSYQLLRRMVVPISLLIGDQRPSHKYEHDFSTALNEI